MHKQWNIQMKFTLSKVGAPGGKKSEAHHTFP